MVHKCSLVEYINIRQNMHIKKGFARLNPEGKVDLNWKLITAIHSVIQIKGEKVYDHCNQHRKVILQNLPFFHDKHS